MPHLRFALSLFAKFYKGLKACVLALLVSSVFSYACWGEDSQLNYEKALSAFKAERFDESMIFLKNALQSSPDNLPAKILMGELLTQMGQYQAAEVEFSEALIQGADVGLFANAWGTILYRLKAFEKIIQFNQFDTFSSTQNLFWQRLRAMACMETRNYKCAKQSYNAVGKLGAYQAEELNGLANIQISLEDYKKATQLLQQALEIDAENAMSWQLMGKVARNQNNLTSALNYLEKAFELAPDDPYILRNLADIYLASNNIKAAQKTVNSILDSSPNDPFAILVNSWIQQDTTLAAKAEAKFLELANKLKSYPKELIYENQSLLFLRGLAAFRQQDYEQAMRDFLRLRQLDDSDISPIILLAKSYIVLGKEKETIELLEQNQSSLMSLPDVMVMLGDLYINKGRNFKALSLLQELQKAHPQNIQVKLLETKLLLSRKKITQGLALLDQLVAEHPQNESVLFVHSVLNLQAQNFQAADNSISQLIQLKPNDASKLNIKGAVLIKLNQLEAAREYIQKALKINPDLLSAKYNLATTYFLQQDNESASLWLKDILRHSPRYPTALLLQSKLLVADGKLQQAIENYRTVLADDKQNIEAQEGLASVYVAQNDLDNALFQLNRLSKFQQDNPKYMLQKAQIYLSLDDPEKSQKELRLLKSVAQEDAALWVAYAKLQLLAENTSEAISALQRAQDIQPKAMSISKQLAEVLLNKQLTDDAQQQIALMAKRFVKNPDVSFLQGRLAEQQGNITLASQFYQETLALDDSYELALAKIYALTTQGLPDEAFKQKIEQIVTQYPDRYFPRNLLAQYYFYNQKPELAALHYEKLLSHPESKNKASLLSRLARIYMPSDMIKSIGYAQDAYQLDKTSHQVLTIYGWLLTQQEKPTQGLELLRKALARNQQNPALHYYIAVSLDKLGLSKEAKSELDALFAKTQDFPESSQARALHDKLSNLNSG